MRGLTLACLAIKWQIVMNWEIRNPACFNLSIWLDDFIDLRGMERAATTLRHLDRGLEGLWDTVRSYLNSLPDCVCNRMCNKML